MRVVFWLIGFFKISWKQITQNFRQFVLEKNAHDGITSFNIDSVEIKCDDNVTLLGINIDFMLRFDDHVSEICKKASKQLAVLKRLGRFLTKQGKMTIYNSFIVSNFNYCPLAWHFSNKIEKIQERALRFINNDFHVISASSTDLYKHTPFTRKEDEANGFWCLQNRKWYCSCLYQRFSRH